MMEYDPKTVTHYEHRYIFLGERKEINQYR